jgi:hypothetical protein
MRLLSLAPEELKNLFDNMEKECDLIRRNALKFAWHMRGGATYEDVLNMSPNEREAISEIIEENLETTKKTQLPFF